MLIQLEIANKTTSTNTTTIITNKTIIGIIILIISLFASLIGVIFAVWLRFCKKGKKDNDNKRFNSKKFAPPPPVIAPPIAFSNKNHFLNGGHLPRFN